MSYFTVLLMLITLYVEKAETEKKEVGEDDLRLDQVQVQESR